MTEDNGKERSPEAKKDLHSEPSKRDIFFFTITLANFNRFL